MQARLFLRLLTSPSASTRAYIIAVLLLLTLSVFPQYQLQWPGIRCKEGGERQSPIDISTSHVVKDFNELFIKYGPLKFSGYQKVLVTGLNNGHTIQFSTEGDESIHPTLTGGPLKHVYRLEQLHFHWVSEHSLNGFKYPMEIHLVHVRSDLTVMKALGKKDGLAIVAVFCHVEAELDDYLQEASEEIMQYIPRLLVSGQRISGILLDLTKLLGPNMKTYYTYAGSLTSPECNEAVIWIIFDRPIFLSDEQYRLFSKVGSERYNFRSLQKLSERSVYTPPRHEAEVPQFVSFVGTLAKVFIHFFKNVTSFLQKGLRSR
ncbi:hypothetical protein K1T71_006463 [Dendrolimus kikuchii]|uniref:Uncharacterized protein n=1 Tax=Dendrolimus kikuchii TaxID=765133 RepID=A0ACC1D1H0_9NEOP|nr:hypothetical protein K1T71_006463 [Dendrolimus kikuchii]